jgi:hypothetical protein
VSEHIEQLKQEARMLNMVGDWRGLDVVLAQLNPLFRDDPSKVLGFYQELVRYNTLRQSILALKLEMMA